MFIETFFISKLLKLKIYFLYQNKFLEKEEKEKIFKKLIKNTNIIYIINIYVENKEIFIISTENEKKHFDDFLEITNNKMNIFIKYNEVYNYLNNNINFEKLNQNNMIVIWKNQYIISEILDCFNDGLIFKTPDSWYSINSEINFEDEFNKKIFILLKNWYSSEKIKNNTDLIKKQIEKIIN